MAILGNCARQTHNEKHEKTSYCVDWVANGTLKQWMIDMTGPEDAWAREQYAALVQAAQRGLIVLGWTDWNAKFNPEEELRAALKAAGEIE